MAITRIPGDRPIDLHPQVTVLTGAGHEKDRWLDRIRAAAESASGGPIVAGVVLCPGDLPGARMVTAAARPPRSSQRVEAARGALEAAKAAEDSARSELARLHENAVETPSDDAVRVAEERVAAASAALEAASAQLAEVALEAEQQTAAARATFEEQFADRRRRMEELEERRAGLVERRAELEAVLAEPEPADVSTVEAALAAYEEQASGGTEPEAERQSLADRWADARRRLADAPGADPPAWLLVPAEEALERARQTLQHAEQAAGAASMDADAAARVEEAHRRVLDAEQRMMDKPGMLSKRKVEAALDAEREALASIGVRSYNDYLQIMATRDSDDADKRIAAARAAVADAEAVWEELHRPLPTPERTAVEAELKSLRAEAKALLRRNVPDEELEAALRGPSVNEGAGEALAALVDAVRSAGGEPGDDPVGAARALVRDIAALRRRRDDAETGLSAAAREAAWVEKTAGELAADLEAQEPQPPAEVVARLAGARARSEAANDELVAAEQALDLAREGAALAAGAADSIEAAEARAGEATVARERAEAELRRLEQDDNAREIEPSGPVEVADLREVVPLEAELYVLGRLASMRAAAPGGGAAPLVVDEGFAGLDDGARGRLLDLLARASAVVQVVVVSDDAELVGWAERLGPELAAVTSVG